MWDAFCSSVSMKTTCVARSGWLSLAIPLSTLQRTPDWTVWTTGYTELSEKLPNDHGVMELLVKDSPWTWRVVVGRDSSVDIATCYGLDCSGIKSRLRGEIFHTYSDRPWGPPSLVYNGYSTWSFAGVKRPGHSVDHPLPSSTKVKERVELYFHFPLCFHGLF